MPDHREIETKLYVPDLPAVAGRLLEQGAVLTAPRVFERNIRYENIAQTLKASGIVVRLRQDTRARLTYKDGGIIENGIISRYEAEVEVSDFEAMHTILGKLGYHPYMTYEKYRTTYRLEDAEIVLDELPYGNFVEIEAPASIIEMLIDSLGLAAAQRFGSSYTHLFDNVRHHLRLPFTDLTFANFDGISVPESAFQPSAT